MAGLGLDLSATIEGSELVDRLMAQMADRTGDVSPIWPKVGDVVVDNMARQFDTEGAHFLGRQWSPLKPEYLAWKIRKGLDPRRLHATGDMRRSFTTRPMDVEEFYPDYAVFRSNDAKAPFHQSGTRNMPARRIFAMTEDFSDEITQVVARYIFENRL